jgi:hypothetical protein
MADKHAQVRRAHGSEALCVETQSREIMALLVHDVVAEAMRLDLNGAPVKRAARANDSPLRRAKHRVRNG